MPRVTDLIRRHLADGLGMPGPVRTTRSCVELRRSEWSPEFETRMRNRLILGALRYGLLHDPSKPQWDRVGRIRTELEHYVATGNRECLVEISNHALIEYEEGNHPLAHFAGRDGGTHTAEVVR